VISFCLPRALDEGEVPGQIGIIHPVVTRPSIRFAEGPSTAITGNGDPALMDCGVMPLTQQNQIVEVGAAAQDPRHHMMSLQVSSLLAARIAAHLVPDQQRPALCLTQQSSGAA